MIFLKQFFLTCTLLSSATAVAQLNRISGQVTLNGRGLGGVYVCARPYLSYPHTPGARCSYTRRGGEYVLRPMTSGYYLVTAQGAGHLLQQPVNLAAENAVRLNFYF